MVVLQLGHWTMSLLGVCSDCLFLWLNVNKDMVSNRCCCMISILFSHSPDVRFLFFPLGKYRDTVPEPSLWLKKQQFVSWISDSHNP
jgi:hypothetical protein